MLTEDEEQEILCDWMDYMGLVYFAIPNGGKRPIQTARRLKRTGVKPGVPDLMICHPHPTAGHAGLFIELKRTFGGSLSEYQTEWLKKLNDKGYLAVMCKGADEAILAIKRYLKLS